MPASALERVARAARWNGGSIMVVAGLSAALSLAGGEFTVGAIAGLVAVVGLREWQGGRMLAAGRAAAEVHDRLVGAELTVLVTVVGYSIWRLMFADFAAEIAALPAEQQLLLESVVGGDRAMLEQMFRTSLNLTYGILIVVTFAYQGGMAWWYHRTLRSTA